VDDLNREIWLSKEHLNQMREHVHDSLPEEACGLVAGQERQVVCVYPVENILHSPVRFRMNPEIQIKVFMEMERKNWDILAIYHSHPEGPEHPSPTDIVESSYPQAVHLIWFRAAGQWRCRGYFITGQRYEECTVRIVPS
jgi:proteasome lid subunit RPN8/RPN11